MLLRLISSLALVAVLSLLGAAGASASPLFSPAPGSPYTTGAAAESLAFSPNGELLASTGLTKDEVAVDSVAADGALTPVQGSPFDTNIPSNSFSGDNPQGVAFSPNGALLATANDAGTVSMFTVGSGGALTGVADTTAVSDASELVFSPDSTRLAVASYEAGYVDIYDVASNGDLTLEAQNSIGGDISGIAFDPTGGLLAVTNSGTDEVGLYTVNSVGTLTAADSPVTFQSGTLPGAVAFGPSGSTVAVADGPYNGAPDDSVYLYSVGSNDNLTAVGSPTSTGDGAHSLMFSQTGGLLAVPGFDNGRVSVFALGTNDALNAVSGSPFAAASGTNDAVFSPSGRLLATANENAGTITVLAQLSGPPGIQVTTPTANATYTEGLVPHASFTCTAGSDGTLKTGTSGCGASIDGAAAIASGAPLNGAVGDHTLIVTAGDTDGTTSTDTVKYTVAAPPHALAGKPSVSGTTVSVPLSCKGTAGSCAATLTLTYTTGGTAAIDARAAKHHKHTYTLGSKSIKLAAGHSGKVSINLNSTGQRLLKKYGKLAVKLTIKVLAGGKTTTTTKTVTFKVKAKKKG